MEGEKKRMSKGCMVALIVVGIIVLLVIALSVVCYVKRDEIAQAVMNKSEQWVTAQIKENLPEGYTEADIDQVVGNFFGAIKSGDISEAQVKKITGQFQTMANDKKIDTAEARQLLEEMKKILSEIPPTPAGEQTN